MLSYLWKHRSRSVIHIESTSSRFSCYIVVGEASLSICPRSQMSRCDVRDPSPLLYLNIRPIDQLNVKGNDVNSKMTVDGLVFAVWDSEVKVVSRLSVTVVEVNDFTIVNVALAELKCEIEMLSSQISNRGRYSISNINQQLTISQRNCEKLGASISSFLQFCVKTWSI